VNSDQLVLAGHHTPRSPKDIQRLYGCVRPPVWSKVAVVGGGPSNQIFFDHSDSLCEELHVLVLNDAVYRIPERYHKSVSFFTLDSRWVRRNREFLNSFAGEKYVALPLDTFPECAGIKGVTYLQWAHFGGLSDDPAFVCTGGNSGYAAINLAYLKGAQQIQLFGYDMHPDDHVLYEQWSPRFRSMIPQLKKRGVTVINRNPDSYIDAFPKFPTGGESK